MIALLALLLSLSCLCSSSAQEALVDSPGVSKHYEAVFSDTRLAISTGSIGLLARHFSSQITINLRGDESGTFSSNQAYYILQNYFKTRRIGGFEFTSMGESDTNPFASGDAEMVQRGNRERVQIYVALSLDGKNYLITQLTIF